MDKLDIDTTKEQVRETVKKMALLMGLDCQIDLKEEVDDRGSKALLISVYAPENGRFLIGREGQNLRSFEQVLRAMFLKKIDGVDNITVDVNDYKKLRANQVIDMAREAITRVRNTQKAEALVPMTAYERRIVHMELASCPDIATESIGAEPNRRIVIKLYP